MGFITSTTHIPTDKLFEIERTTPIRFFYRLPLSKRRHFIKNLVDQRIHNEIQNNNLIPNEKDNVHKYMMDYMLNNRFDNLMKEISPEKFEWIKKHTDDETFFSFYHYYEILQPIIENLIDVEHLYDKYPEYII